MSENNEHKEINFADYEAFGIDFDGTLADSVGTHTEARKAALQQMAEKAGDERFLTIPPELQHEAHQHGSNPTAIIGWLLQQVGIAREITDPVVTETVETKNDIYHKLCADGLEAITGSVELVRLLHNRKSGSTYVTTTAERDSQVLPFIARYDLKEEFPLERLVTFENVNIKQLKPNPLVYELAIERAELSDNPRQFLAVEDTPGGIESARRAGATALALCTTHDREKFLVVDESLRPDFIYPDFTDLLAFSKTP